MVWKSYADDRDGFFGTSGSDDEWLVYWPLTAISYYRNPKLMFCPEATKPYLEGGRPPFGAWTREMDMVPPPVGSYGINFWVSAAPPGGREVEDFWQTPYVSQAASVPLMLDCYWSDVLPYPQDEPAPFEDAWDWWPPNINEMRLVCINRHNGGINGVFMDFSARKVGLKELWLLKWHRQWPEGRDHLPVWPEWMQNFTDY
ncbi:MAG: hypothetical protein ACYTEQ_28475 [Planctomycetota bacterium]|jgi:hypothetical protein